jgi:nitroimidazol reductase NimA-like FMN-containing flavoprotein (pyridoxamine 5'-phosphate oxidase superfamily)
MSITDPTNELTAPQCWEFLASQGMGRFAFTMVDEVHIVPVNHAVDGERLLIRSAPGDKLLGVALGGPVAFEADQVDQHRGTSVVVRGRARILPEDEAHRADEVGLRPWVPGAKYDVVEITAAHISGRTYALDRNVRR